MQGYTVVISLLACFCCVSALRCFVCNSEVDPGCDADEAVMLENNYLIDCSSGRQGDFKPVLNATVCWKQSQNIEGKTIVDRMCGEKPVSEVRCYDRVGTKKIKVRYCVCDRDGCNGVGPSAVPATATLGLLAMMTLAVLFGFESLAVA